MTRVRCVQPVDSNQVTHMKRNASVALMLISIAAHAPFAARAADPKPTTAPVAEVQADGSVLLKPEGGRIHGFKLKVDRKAEPTLVSWTDSNEYVEWPHAAKKGRYTVEVTYACAPNSGGEFALVAAANRVTGRTESTGDWQTFKTVKLNDPLKVLNDDTSIALRPTGGINHVLMNVRSVRLIPMADEKKK